MNTTKIAKYLGMSGTGLFLIWSILGVVYGLANGPHWLLTLTCLVFSGIFGYSTYKDYKKLKQ